MKTKFLLLIIFFLLNSCKREQKKLPENWEILSQRLQYRDNNGKIDIRSGNFTYNFNKNKIPFSRIILLNASLVGYISGFFTWIGLSVNAEVHKEEIHEVLEQLQNSQKVTGRVTIDMNVTGLYPNVEVTAMAYVNVLQIENSTGNTFRIASAGNPIDDTGATDENGNDLPTKDNNSVIYL